MEVYYHIIKINIRKGLVFNTLFGNEVTRRGQSFLPKGRVTSLQGFSFNEVSILSENLNTTYNLETWVKLNKNKSIIAVSGKKYTQIKNLISPYIIPCMKYKLPLPLLCQLI